MSQSRGSTATPAPSECQLTEKLRHSGHRELRDLSCLVEGAKVIVHGRVSSFYLKQLAQETLRSVQGVDHVDNQIDVV